jgi:hypothetical protein
VLLTEDEMKTKWCPMARVAHVSNAGKTFEVSFNRAWTKPVRDGTHDQVPAAAKCLGSRCGVWRWEMVGPDQKPTKGYCGLAWQPL